MYCTSITTPQCQNQPYSYGSLPNVFLQRNVTEIRIELEFYDALLASGCSENLRLFLCGTYIPFCAENQNPFMMPCREVCEEVQGACLDHFRFLYGGLPWPNKLQCHRFPSSNDDARTCFMPGDVQGGTNRNFSDIYGINLGTNGYSRAIYGISECSYGISRDSNGNT